MNREKLKICFDAISPTDEQEEKMLAEILKHKRNVFKPTAIYKYGAAFAAVLAIGVCLSVWPQLQNYENKMTEEIHSYESGLKAAEETKHPGISDKTLEESQQKSANKGPENTKDTTDEAPAYVGGKSSESNSGISNKPANVENEQIEGSNNQDAEPNKQTESAGLEVFRVVEPSANESSSLSGDLVEDDNINAMMMAVPVPEDGYASKMAVVESEHRELTYDEIMNDEVYGKLFPERVLEGFEFVGATIFEGSLDADFKSENGKLHIRIYNKANADSSLVIITLDELSKYEKVGNLSFSVLCGDYIVFYEIDGKDISEIYDMVVSTNYFIK